ncbi:MAG: V-type ATPase subunit [Candidatus Micrarchaeaceae archaeon]
MAYSGSKAASVYGYSSTRVKAMESKLLGSDILGRLAGLEDVPSMVGLLLQTDYKQYIEEFGGMDMKAELADFALSKSLECDVQKLIYVVPKEQKEMTMHIVGRSDAQNIKLVFYAKAEQKDYDYISRYVVESYNIDAGTVKRAIEELTVEDAAALLAVRTPYGIVVNSALNAYRNTHNLTEVNAAIDKGFFRLLEGAIRKLSGISRESASIIRMDMEMRNILTILRAKRYGMSIDKVNDLLIERGITSIEDMLDMFESSSSIGELAMKVSSFDLKDAVSAYESNKWHRMLQFEIAMRNAIFKKAVALLRHSSLSYGVIIGYFYLKEIEVFTLRILINGRSLGLSNEEINRMIAWKLGA